MLRQENPTPSFVPDLECPEFRITDVVLESRTVGHRRIGAEVTFSCPVGFVLVGEPKVTCLMSGEYKGIQLSISGDSI